MKKIILPMMLSMLSLTSHAATVVFQDDFESYAVGSNKTNFSGNWTVTEGSVDLVGPGYFGGLALAGGKSVDLDGSTGNAGTFKSKDLNLTAGNYTLTFDLSGNKRVGSDSVNVSVTLGLASQTYTFPSNFPYTTQTLLFSVLGNSTSNIIFNHLGGDNIGLLLDNVTLTHVSNVNAVPIPAAAWLFGSAAFGFLGARRKKA